MNRRTKEMVGCVRFPVDDPTWKNTGEGGLFVKLVVVPRAWDEYQACCGATTSDFMAESYIGDTRGADSSFHYPHADRAWTQTPEPDELWSRYSSIAYLAVIVLGSTGWSGWSDERGSYWRCDFTDLDENGMAIVNALAAIYPGCDLRLVTWLDT